MRFARRIRDRKSGGWRLARALGRDPNGATIVEFALVAAPFFALLVAILETALVFLAQQSLETAGEAASRLIMTGQAQLGTWTQDQYKTKVCQQLPPFLSCSNLAVDVQTAASFSSVNTSIPPLQYDPVTHQLKTAYKIGGASDIVVVRLMYLWPISTGPLGFNLSNQPGNNRLLLSTSVAQTEPYTS